MCVVFCLMPLIRSAAFLRLSGLRFCISWMSQSVIESLGRFSDSSVMTRCEMLVLMTPA